MAVAACIAAAASAKDVHLGKEVTFDAEVIDIQWFGKDKNTLLLQTRSGRVHRSTDHGETWEEFTPKLQELASKGASSSSATTLAMTEYEGSAPVRIGRFSRSHADHDVVLALAVTGLAAGLISTDAGANWRRLGLEYRVRSWIFHYSKPQWALVSFWNEFCRKDLVRPEKPCTHDLYVTKDAGGTFELVARRIVQFSWGAPEKSQEDTIFMTQFRETTGNQKRLTRWMTGIDLKRTDDLGKTVTPLLLDGDKFQISNGYLLVVKVMNNERQQITLMVSADGGVSFQEARLPHRIRHRSYTLLDTSEGAVVLHVNRGGDIGDVYISDDKGIDFSLSVQNNVRKQGVCAFEKVFGLNGIYVANVVELPDSLQAETTEAPHADPKNEEEEGPGKEGASGGSQSMEKSIRWRRLGVVEAEELPSADAVDASGGLDAGLDHDDDDAEGAALLSRADHMARQRERGKARRSGGPLTSAASAALEAPDGTRRLQEAVKIRTIISFDKGGAWTTIRAPEQDRDGKAVQCSSKTCHLHLHAFTDLFDFAPIYSYKNAVGILMGSGNVGEALSFDKSATNTYMSRDGGVTWTEVRKGTFIYEYGNHGGLVVIADMGSMTGSAAYSLNEGHDWTTFSIGEPFVVSNVLIEPDATAKKFVVYGLRGDKGVLHHMDFSGLHERECLGVDQVGTDKSDYEYWSPTDEGSCILGHKNTYVRRKQMAECHNGEDFDRKEFVKNCPCKRENFECAPGFQRSTDHLTCREDPKARLYGHVNPDCSLGQLWMHPYRRVPGDTCEGGFDGGEKVMVRCTKDAVKAAVQAMYSAVPEPPMEAQAPAPAAEGGLGGIWFSINLVAEFFKGVGTACIVAALTYCVARSDFVRKSGIFDRFWWSMRSARAGRSYAETRSARVGAEMVGAGYAPPGAPSSLSV